MQPKTEKRKAGEQGGNDHHKRSLPTVPLIPLNDQILSTGGPIFPTAALASLMPPIPITADVSSLFLNLAKPTPPVFSALPPHPHCQRAATPQPAAHATTKGGGGPQYFAVDTSVLPPPSSSPIESSTDSIQSFTEDEEAPMEEGDEGEGERDSRAQRNCKSTTPRVQNIKRLRGQTRTIHDHDHAAPVVINVIDSSEDEAKPKPKAAKTSRQRVSGGAGGGAQAQAAKQSQQAQTKETKKLTGTPSPAAPGQGLPKSSHPTKAVSSEGATKKKQGAQAEEGEGKKGRGGARARAAKRRPGTNQANAKKQKGKGKGSIVEETKNEKENENEESADKQALQILPLTSLNLDRLGHADERKDLTADQLSALGGSVLDYLSSGTDGSEESDNEADSKKDTSPTAAAAAAAAEQAPVEEEEEDALACPPEKKMTFDEVGKDWKTWGAGRWAWVWEVDEQLAGEDPDLHIPRALAQEIIWLVDENAKHTLGKQTGLRVALHRMKDLSVGVYYIDAAKEVQEGEELRALVDRTEELMFMNGNDKPEHRQATEEFEGWLKYECRRFVRREAAKKHWLCRLRHEREKAPTKRKTASCSDCETEEEGEEEEEIEVPVQFPPPPPPEASKEEKLLRLNFGEAILELPQDANEGRFRVTYPNDQSDVEDESYGVFNLPTILKALRTAIDLCPQDKPSLNAMKLALYCPTIFWNLVRIQRGSFDDLLLAEFGRTLVKPRRRTPGTRGRDAVAEMRKVRLAEEERLRRLREEARKAREEAIEAQMAKEQCEAYARFKKQRKRAEVRKAQRQAKLEQREQSIAKWHSRQLNRPGGGISPTTLTITRSNRVTAPDTQTVLEMVFTHKGTIESRNLKGLSDSHKKAVYKHCVERGYRCATIEEAKHEERGRCIRVTETVLKDEYLFEYEGELIQNRRAELREEKYARSEAGCFMFFFRHDGRKVCIDATNERLSRVLDWGPGRLVNHSKQKPNLRIETTSDSRDMPRLYFVALRDIQKGEELLVDYGDRDKAAVKAHPWLLA